MESTSDKIKVYVDGVIENDTGAYAYVVLESKNCGPINIAGADGRAYGPSELKARFGQAGKSNDRVRMSLRAVYEGVRHCPDGCEPEVYTESYFLDSILESTPANGKNGDIAERYRKYVAEHHITPVFIITDVYGGFDLPDDDHKEWTWMARNLCEEAIKTYKENLC